MSMTVSGTEIRPAVELSSAQGKLDEQGRVVVAGPASVVNTKVPISGRSVIPSEKARPWETGPPMS
jgi:hypothetical protein